MEWQMGRESRLEQPRLKPFVCKIHVFVFLDFGGGGTISAKQQQEELWCSAV